MTGRLARPRNPSRLTVAALFVSGSAAAGFSASSVSTFASPSLRGWMGAAYSHSRAGQQSAFAASNGAGGGAMGPNTTSLAGGPSLVSTPQPLVEAPADNVFLKIIRRELPAAVVYEV